MMTSSSYTIILFIAALAVATAFAPSELPAARKMAATSYAQMKRLNGFAAASFNSRSRVCNGGVCKMVSDGEDGTVYDDEPMSEPERDTMSESMKERLRREASVGLDSDKPQSNVILYISAVVALLVLVGGQGTLY